MVVEVVPPPGRTFHPKFWVLRFVDSEGRYRHRFVCLSRNLTRDQSWDTVLVFDEDETDAPALDPGPLCDFLADVLAMSLREVGEQREASLAELIETLAASHLRVPKPFTAGTLLPLGTSSGGAWPLPARADSLVVISPFLDVGSLSRLPDVRGRSVLLSRSDTFDRVGAQAVKSTETFVLQPIADGPEADEAASTPTDGVSKRHPPRGLHAKVLAWDVGPQGHLLTGSANCTSAAFAGNIEMGVLLTGPASSCGAEAILADPKDGSSLIRMMQPFSTKSEEGVADPAYDAERIIEDHHARLAGLMPTLVVNAGSGRSSAATDRFDLQLEMELPHDLVGSTTVHPVALKATAHARRLAMPLPTWRNVSLAALAPYLAVHTTLAHEGVEVTRDCVITCEVDGAPVDRQARLLRELLSRQEDVLRYLALLLGDPSVDDLIDRLKLDPDEETDDDPSKKRAWEHVAFDDLVLLEPLVRAAARDDDALERAHKLLEDLRDDDGHLPQLSADFLALWQVISEARVS